MIRSATVSTSSSLCVMKRMETPLARSPRMISSSLVISPVVRDEVGSSMMSSLASSDTALAISTSCICETLRCFTSVRGSMSTTPRAARCLRLSSTIRRVWMKPRRPVSMRPWKMLSATVMARERDNSWWIIATPRLCASRGSRKRTGTPSNSTVP